MFKELFLQASQMDIMYSQRKEPPYVSVTGRGRSASKQGFVSESGIKERNENVENFLFPFVICKFPPIEHITLL